MKISEVLIKYKTDKHKNDNSGHCYGFVYDKLFEKFDRETKLEIIEIGTAYGESLLAWYEYFPNANITGIDIVDKVENKRLDINYIISDVNNLKLDKEYDIVIDDGSHKLNDVIYTVENFKLKKNGIMVIEDCQIPNDWLEKIKSVTNYLIEVFDLRNINQRQDDYLIVLRNDINKKS